MALPNPDNTQLQSPRQRQTRTYAATPCITISPEGDRLLVGDSTTSSVRSWTTLKLVGDGSFASVWLCDWHSPLPPNTPLSLMQRGPNVRPEWAGRRLVALKRSKRQWGGWMGRVQGSQGDRIITLDPNASKYHPPIRLLCAPSHPRALFRVRAYGRKPIPTHQISQRQKELCRRTRSIHLSTNGQCTRPCPLEWILSLRREARELAGDYNRFGRLCLDLAPYP
ncbi:unnamed protein product [Rhizoctonia solani]|nr:unnamed protein product [Rhizoctonia solani]